MCRLQLNSNTSGYYTPYTSIPYDPACNGNDYARNIATPDIDMASLHLYPTVAPYWTQSLEQQVQSLHAAVSCLHVWQKSGCTTLH